MRRSLGKDAVLLSEEASATLDAMVVSGIDSISGRFSVLLPGNWDLVSVSIDTAVTASAASHTMSGSAFENGSLPYLFESKFPPNHLRAFAYLLSFLPRRSRLF